MNNNRLSDREVLDKIHQINLEMLLALDEICKKHDIQYFLSCGALLGAIRHRDFIPWDNDVDIVMTRPEFEKLLPFLRSELDTEKYELILPEDYKEKYFDMVPRINYKNAEIRMDPEYSAYYNGWANRIVLDFYFFDRVPDNFRGHLLVRRLEFLYGLANGKRYDIDTKNYHGLMKIAAVLLRAAGKCFSADALRKRILNLAVRFDNDPSVTTYRVTNDTIHSFGMSFPIAWYEKARPVPIGVHTFPAPLEAEKVLTEHFGDYMKLPPEEERIPHWGFLLINAENFIFTE